jgi:hypothetical protein
MMLQNARLILVLSMTVVTLIACTPYSPEELLTTQIDTVAPNDPGSILVFEQFSTSSAATGACKSTWVDRWYGTDDSFDEVREGYQAKIAEAWETWPEDVVPIWRLESENGLFSSVLVDVSGGINPEREGYVLPEFAIQELEDHPTAYLLRLGHMSVSQTRRCFEH